MIISREIREGIQPVGIDERPIFNLTTTPWGSAPTSVSVKAWKYNESAQTYTDVTSTVFAVNTPSVNGDVITLSPLIPQAIGDKYRIEIKFTTGGSVLEPYANILVER